MRMSQYRAKTTKTSKWIYGGYYRHQNRTLCPMGDFLTESDFTDYILTAGFSDWNMPTPIEMHEVAPETVCEPTGYSVQSRELYEKDILGFIFHDCMTDDYVYEEGVVLFMDGAWRIAIIAEEEEKEWRENPYLNSIMKKGDKMKIVGNIIDNPERATMDFWEKNTITVNDEYWTSQEN